MANPKISPSVLIAAVAAIICVIVAAVVALTIFSASKSTPAIATMLGFVGPVLLGLLTLLKVDRTEQHVNGTMDAVIASKLAKTAGQIPAGPTREELIAQAQDLLERAREVKP